MDDVLCHLDDDKRIAYLHALSGMAHADVADAIWGSGFEDRTDAGEFTPGEYLTEFGNRIEYPISRQEWCEYRRCGMTPYPEVLAVASRWSEQYRMGVLTNNGPLLHEEIDTLFPELRTIFGEHIYCSSQFGLRKPNPQIFLMACEALGISPAETLFIDDRAENVDGALEAGLKTYRFVSVEAFIGELMPSRF